MSRGRRGKDKLRSKESLRRRMPVRDPKPRILIVCEGEKTEPQYFNKFRIEKRMPRSLMRIIGAGCDPKGVAEVAKKWDRDAKNDKLPFKHIWCVFDRDDHTRLPDAFQQVQHKKNDFSLAFSNPSFELWFLLHFEDQTANIDRQDVISQLKRHIPAYDKSLDVYDDLKEFQATAIDRAKKLDSEPDAIRENPSTTVYELVVLLNSI